MKNLRKTEMNPISIATYLDWFLIGLITVPKLLPSVLFWLSFNLGGVKLVSKLDLDRIGSDWFVFIHIILHIYIYFAYLFFIFAESWLKSRKFISLKSAHLPKISLLDFNSENHTKYGRSQNLICEILIAKPKNSCNFLPQNQIKLFQK